MSDDTKRAINTWANVAQLAALVFFAGALWANVEILKDALANHEDKFWHDQAGLEITALKTKLDTTNSLLEDIREELKYIHQNDR